MTEITWTGLAGDGQFSDAANWSADAVPGSGDTAVFAGQTITSSQDETVGSLDLAGGALGIAAGVFAVPDGLIAGPGVLGVTGGELNMTATDVVGATLVQTGGEIVSHGPGGVLDGSTTTGAVTIQGTVSVADGGGLTLLGTLANQGVLALDGARDPTELLIGAGGATLSGAGSVTMTGSQTLIGSAPGAGATLTNAGNTILSTGAGDFIGVGDLDLVNQTQGVIDVSNGQLILRTPAAVANAGLMESTGLGDLLVLDTTIDNAAGTVAASGLGDISLDGGAIVGGALTIGAGAQVEADLHAGEVDADAVTNAGTLGANNVGLALAGTVSNAQGVVLAIGADVTLAGADIQGGTLQTQDRGAIVVGVGGGVLDGSGSPVTSTGRIAVTSAGSLGVAGTVDNTGAIALTAGSLVAATDGATLANSGRISGSGSLGGPALTLVNEARGVIVSAGPGGLAVSGGAISNAGIIEGEGAGGTVVTGAVDNTGSLIARDGDLSVLGAVTGSGWATIDGGALVLGAAISGKVMFASAPTGELVLADALAFAGSILGVSPAGGDSLDLEDVDFAGASEVYTGNARRGVLTVSSGPATASLQLYGDYLNTSFVLGEDASGGTIVTASPNPPSPGPAALALASAMASVAAHATAADAWPANFADRTHSMLTVARP